jgi:radical SAM superfamily enzyme YgiQ (UPF0313 family)
VAELETIYRLGWQGLVFVCDDNFIGNKTHARAILRELIPWSQSRGEPFKFHTQTTVDLGRDLALIDEMTEAQFVELFLGVESPEEEALARSGKHHNCRTPMEEDIGAIQANGLSFKGSFILGLDGERPGAGERIISFIERTAIPLAMVNLLQPAPRTRLWERLQKEGRLLEKAIREAKDTDSIGGEQLFLPSRPWEQILDEYHHVWDTIYDPGHYLGRCYRFVLGMRPTRAAIARRQGKSLPPLPVPPAPKPLPVRVREILVFLRYSWKLGVVGATRWQYWRQLLGVARKNPSRLKGYLVCCAYGEDIFDLRDLLRQRRLGLAKSG